MNNATNEETKSRNKSAFKAAGIDQEEAIMGRISQAAVAAGVLLSAIWGSTARADTMTFAMQPFPPYAIDEHGIAQGVFPELLQQVCAAINTICKIEIYPWRRAMKLAEKGLVDGILIVQRTPEKLDAFYLTEPIVQSSYGIYGAYGGVRMSGEAHKVDYAIGLSRKKFDNARAERFNAALHALVKNGTLYAIARKAGVAQPGFATADTGS
jgi:ABC-type amino acid transport substrate-binding protein